MTGPEFAFARSSILNLTQPQLAQKFAVSTRTIATYEASAPSRMAALAMLGAIYDHIHNNEPIVAAQIFLTQELKSLHDAEIASMMGLIGQ